MFTDYLSSKDLNEAIAAAQELAIPGFGKVLVDLGINRAYDSLNSVEQDHICDLVVELIAKGVFSADDLMAAVGEHAAILEDLMLDIPAAPKVLGRMMGLAISKHLCNVADVDKQASSIEAAEPRRGLIAAALVTIKDAMGENEMVDMVKKSGMDVQKQFERDEEIESYLPTLKEFAKDQGLEALLQ